MMNRKDQHQVIRSPSEHLYPKERPLHEIEWLAEDFLHQFFEGLWTPLGRREFAEPRHRRAGRSDHLHGLALARQEGQTQNFLPVHHSPDRRLAVLGRDHAAHLDEGADVIRHICHRYGRRLPQFPLGKGQRLESGLPTLQPLLQTGSIVLRHVSVSGSNFRRNFLGISCCGIAEQSANLIIRQRFQVHLVSGCRFRGNHGLRD